MLPTFDVHFAHGRIWLWYKTSIFERGDTILKAEWKKHAFTVKKTETTENEMDYGIDM